jgi:L-serine dehydratase
MNNELAKISKTNLRKEILNLWDVMDESILNGLKNEGILDGGLKVKRRAPSIYKILIKSRKVDPLKAMDFVNAYAMAVNEENASGGKVVTAPTNGAAGIIPAVIRYYLEFTKKANKEGIIRFILTAGTIGILYKKNASISGAEVGCQGEVGVACSMAAGGLVSALGGSNKEIEAAAEIAMEHNLGLTCDPIKGLVQIPCIERNAIGAVKSINAARLSIISKGNNKIKLDQVIKTMMDTGKDMHEIYKETSKGGLAVNIIEC